MRIVVAGALANKPGYGGEAWVRLAWVRGLEALGAEVLFVEELAGEVPRKGVGAGGESGSDPRPEFFTSVCSRRGLLSRAALLTPDGEGLAGVPPDSVRDFAEGADLLVNISGHLRPGPLTRAVGRRAYIDLDPGFTQFWYAQGQGELGLEEHDVHFTVGENVGTARCSIPTTGIRWLPVRQPVILDDWPFVQRHAPVRFTTVASWRGAFGPVEFEGRSYGLKAHEFRKIVSLPRRLPVPAEVALDIHPGDAADLEKLQAHGWEVVDPLAVAGTPEAFRDYVQASGAELSVAQGIYVDTRSAWFSDRSVRYLATGRPVVVQDTGIADHLPIGDGILTFRTLDDAVSAAERVIEDHDHHAEAARQVAETFFDADKVLTDFLDRALSRRWIGASAVADHSGAGKSPATRRPAARESPSAVRRPARAGRGPSRANRGPAPNGGGPARAATSPSRVARRPARTAKKPPPGGKKRPLAIVAGRVAGVPHQGGGTWAVLQYVLGLRQLGWDVHLLDQIEEEEIRPAGHPLEASENRAYFTEVIRRFGLEGSATLLLSRSDRTVGVPLPELAALASQARVLLNLSGTLRAPELKDLPAVRVYVDLDPAFTQVWHEAYGEDVGLDGHSHFATVGLNVGLPDCPVPTCDVDWIPMLPPVFLEAWPMTGVNRPDAWTTVANWRGYGSVAWEGRVYGQKAHAFRELFPLPSRTARPFEVALSIHPDEEDDLRSLSANGWRMVEPLEAAGNPDRYQGFINASFGEIGVAKAGYVDSRSGWFSDRSACYLAAGRPVLAQDTGFSHHLPSEKGLLAFSDLEEAAERAEAVERDYSGHAVAARRFAEEYLDSDRVLGSLLREVGG